MNEEIRRLRWAAIAAGNIPELLTTEGPRQTEAAPIVPVPLPKPLPKCVAC